MGTFCVLRLMYLFTCSIFVTGQSPVLSDDQRQTQLQSCLPPCTIIEFHCNQILREAAVPAHVFPAILLLNTGQASRWIPVCAVYQWRQATLVFTISFTKVLNHDGRINPFYFGGHRSKFKVTMDIYRNKLVNTIETKPLCSSSSNLANMLTMLRG